MKKILIPIISFCTKKLIDFSSLDIFKNIGISSTIITLRKLKNKDSIKVYKQKHDYNNKINNLNELL